MRLFAPTLAAVLLLSGCIAANDRMPSTGETIVPLPATSSQEPALSNSSESGPAILSPPAPPVDFSSLHQLDLALRQSMAAVALDLRLDFGAQNQCEFMQASMSDTKDSGPVMIALQEPEDAASGPEWAVISRGRGSVYLDAHAGPLDTRILYEAGGQGAAFTGSKGTFSGAYRFTLIGRDLVPLENPYMTGNYSLAFSLSCDAPFAVLEARSGTSILLADATNWTGGAGINAFFVGNVNVQDSVAATLSSPVVRAAASGFGSHTARITLQHPEGSREWTFLPDESDPASRFHAFEGGPGHYACTADRAGAHDALWCAAWGLDGAFDLAANLVPNSVIQSPFQD